MVTSVSNWQDFFGFSVFGHFKNVQNSLFQNTLGKKNIVKLKNLVTFGKYILLSKEYIFYFDFSIIRYKM
jgi:hypothetical protein